MEPQRVSTINDGPKVALESEIGKRHKLNNQTPAANDNDLGRLLDAVPKALGSILCTPEKKQTKHPQKSKPPHTECAYS